jgi:hypothetical protein
MVKAAARTRKRIEHGSNGVFHLRQRNAARHWIEGHAGREFPIHRVYIEAKLL